MRLKRLGGEERSAPLFSKEENGSTKDVKDVVAIHLSAFDLQELAMLSSSEALAWFKKMNAKFAEPLGNKTLAATKLINKETT